MEMRAADGLISGWQSFIFWTQCSDFILFFWRFSSSFPSIPLQGNQPSYSMSFDGLGWLLAHSCARCWSKPRGKYGSFWLRPSEQLALSHRGNFWSLSSTHNCMASYTLILPTLQSKESHSKTHTELCIVPFFEKGQKVSTVLWVTLSLCTRLKFVKGNKSSINFKWNKIHFWVVVEYKYRCWGFAHSVRNIKPQHTASALYCTLWNFSNTQSTYIRHTTGIFFVQWSATFPNECVSWRLQRHGWNCRSKLLYDRSLIPATTKAWLML